MNKIFLFFLFFFAAQYGNSGVHCKDHPTSSDLRKFMDDSGLIKPGEEVKFFNGQFIWALSHVVDIGDGKDECLLVMNVCYQHKDQPAQCDNTQIWEVLAFSDGKLSKFEDVYPAPSKLRAKFVDRLETQYPFDHYYAELSGDSALSVMKASYAKLYFDRNRMGLTGIVVPTGRASFDPTPERNWKIVDANFSLRLENSVEVVDVYPHDFDYNFDAMLSGCLVEFYEGVKGCLAIPWNGSLDSIFYVD